MKRKGRANIQVGKPELPPFLKRMKEQIVTNETTIEDKSKRLQKADERDFEDRKDEAPTVVKLKDCDITEEEYKRLKEGKNCPNIRPLYVYASPHYID